MPHRPFNASADTEPVLDLVLAARSAIGGQLCPSYTRVRTLLDCRLWSPARDARVWEEESRGLIGFAGLFRPDPHGDYLPLQWVVHPQVAGTMIDAMLEWSVARAHEIAMERGKAVTLFVTTTDSNSNQLPGHGFARKEVSIVSMVRPLVDLP